MVLDYEVRQEWIKNRRRLRKQSKEASDRRKVLKLIFTLLLLFLSIYGFTKEPWYINNFEKDIIVSGNHVLDASLVRQLVCPFFEKPLFQVNPKAVESRLEQLSIVNKAFVRRYIIPRPKVEILLWEEFPWANLTNNLKNPAYLVVSQTGRIISVNDFPQIEKPKLLVVANENLHLNSAQIVKWQGILDFIASQDNTPVQYLDLTNPFDIRVQTASLNIKLGAIDNTFQKRLLRLPSVLAGIKDYRPKLVYLDLSLDSNIPIKLSEKLPKEKIEHE